MYYKHQKLFFIPTTMSFILGLSGSLRKASACTGILRAASKCLPNDARMEIADIKLPLFNRDLEVVGKPPDAVRLFRQKIEVADAIIFSVPEHTYGIPGPLKNALDWAVRSYLEEPNPFNGKLCGVIGVGLVNKPRYYRHLEDWAKEMNMMMVERSLYINKASVELNAFNHETGDVMDEQVRKNLMSFVQEVANEAKYRREPIVHPK